MALASIEGLNEMRSRTTAITLQDPLYGLAEKGGDEVVRNRTQLELLKN